ncbi:MAG: hypothetical protein U9R28_05960 [Pseudomonadota bacterium]|nr:hypothetical protein [Pseudomonadota bacterium]
MTTKSKLKNALSAIDDAKRALKRAKQVEAAYSDAGKALRELDEAENYIRKAMREVD